MAQWTREQEAADQRASARTSAVVSRVARALRLHKLADQERRNAAQSNVVARYMETGRCQFGHRNCTSTEHGDGLAYVPPSAVTVHHTNGCELCGSQDEHTHSHEDWRNLIDSVDPWALPPPPVDILRLNLPSAPRDTTTPNTQGEAMATQHEDIFSEIARLYDTFFKWMFRNWGKSSEEVAKLQRPVKRISRKEAKGIKARVDAKLATKQASPPGMQKKTKDTRPQPEPVDLDALASTPPPQGTRTVFRRPPPMPLNAWSNVNQKWCSCEGNAHDARCRFASVGGLNTRPHFQPPPGGGTPKPEPANQP